MRPLRQELHVPIMPEELVEQLLPSASTYATNGHPGDRCYRFEEEFERATGLAFPRFSMTPGFPDPDTRAFVHRTFAMAKLPRIDDLSKDDVIAILERWTAPDCPHLEWHFLIKALENNLNDPLLRTLVNRPTELKPDTSSPDEYFRFFPCEQSRLPRPFDLETVADIILARRAALLSGQIHGPLAEPIA